MELVRGNKVIRATQKSYEVLYRDRGFRPKKQTQADGYPKHTGGGWYELSNGEKVQGKEEAENLEAGE